MVGGPGHSDNCLLLFDCLPVFIYAEWLPVVEGLEATHLDYYEQKLSVGIP
jgi:hypothetical protein